MLHSNQLMVIGLTISMIADEQDCDTICLGITLQRIPYPTSEHQLWLKDAMLQQSMPKALRGKRLSGAQQDHKVGEQRMLLCMLLSFDIGMLKDWIQQLSLSTQGILCRHKALG